MANPWGAAVTISSLGTSPVINLDPTARVTQAVVSVGTWAGDLTLQGSLDVYLGGTATTVTWCNCSTVHLSSQAPDGQVLTFLSPIAGLRLSSSATTGGTATLTVLQTIIA